MEKQRSNFTGKLGFVLAAAGSAVGLGNIWRFPYLAAQHGGGIFLLVYLILVITFGFTLATAEFALGRKTGLSAVGAFGKLSKKFKFLGYLEAIVPMIILPYYCVIGGWVTKYAVTFISGQHSAAATDGFFGNFIGNPTEPMIWFGIYLLITALVVILGVEKGIEKVSKVMMPVLLIISIGIVIYTLFLPGATDGLKYYLLPDFSKFSIKTVLAAMGQLFYSMSLAMGIGITYGSYMKKKVDIESSVRQIEIFDTGIAVLAGLMVIPAVFAFGGGDVSAGPGLMFVTLPKVFESMTGGNIVGIAFFILVLFAALTSSIALMETIVSNVMDIFKTKRLQTSIGVLLFVILLGIPSSLGNGIWSHIKLIGMDFLTFFDFISNSVIMPIVAFLTCIFIGYVIKPKSIIEEVESSGKFKSQKLFTIVIKYFAPICIVAILISALLEAFGIMKI